MSTNTHQGWLLVISTLKLNFVSNYPWEYVGELQSIQNPTLPAGLLTKICSLKYIANERNNFLGGNHSVVSLPAYNEKPKVDITKLKGKAQKIESNLAAMAKECSRTIAEFDEETNLLVQKLRKSSDDQVKEIADIFLYLSI